MKKFLLFLICCILAMPVVFDTTGGDVYATTQTSKKKAKKKTSRPKTTKKKKTKVTPRTSGDAQRMQAATEEEIKRTQQEIEENNRRIAQQLSQLQLIDAEIADSEHLIADISRQIAVLDSRIDTLSVQIATNEGNLATLRNKYLKAIKQMRLSRGKMNALAFVFSSSSFSQAYRRIRYLREFSKWRTQKAAQIMAIQTSLILQKELLAQTKGEKNVILANQVKAKESLSAQQSQQTNLVAELRRNGQSLRSHLKEKQAEADNLKSQISILIAEEQRKAEEERRKREEQQRIAEEAARQRAEQERLEAERQATVQQQQSEQQPQQTTEVASSNKKKKKKTQTATAQTDNRSYADARGRQRRGRRDTQTTGQMPTQTTSGQAGSFEKAKGLLPHPVSGKFQIVSQFGRHAHPDIPDVEYDNPGIDAEVSPGASAQAVFDGKVSGVYVLKGFRTVVIVSHGNYYTVYGNIATPSVKTGDTVTQGQALGKLFSDSEDNNRTTIHFEVWRSRDKLNPTEWIK